MKRGPKPHMDMSGTIMTVSLGDRQVFRIHQVAPFLAVYRIGDGPNRWTLRPGKARQLAKEAIAAEIRKAEGE